MGYRNSFCEVINCDSQEDLNTLGQQAQYEASVIIVAGRVVKNRYGVTTPT